MFVLKSGLKHGYAVKCLPIYLFVYCLLYDAVAQQVAAIAPNLIDNLAASLFIHLDLGAYGDEILEGRVARSVDRGGVFTVVTLCAERQVVGGS